MKTFLRMLLLCPLVLSAQTPEPSPENPPELRPASEPPPGPEGNVSRPSSPERRGTGPEGRLPGPEENIPARLRPERSGPEGRQGVPVREPEETIRPQYRGAALDILLQEISERTGKTILRDPKVPNINITLTSREPMSVDEFLKAVESLLAMNNIALVPFRDEFLKVVPAEGVERSGVPLVLDPGEALDEEDEMVSKMVTLRHMDYQEVQTLITERLSTTAKVQPLERNNALLLTDTRANIRRIERILELVDRPAEVREEVKIYQLRNAPAEDVKASLEALIEESRSGEGGGSARRNTSRPVRTPRGVIRPGGESPDGPGGGGEGGTPPGLVSGRVQIVADERTNILLIVSRPENDAFFEDMIGALDKEVDPEIAVRIFNLQFADAEEVSSTLNELIGAASEDNDGPNVAEGEDGGSERPSGQSIRDFIRRRNQARETTGEGAAGERGNIGRIGENTRILADKRTNALILMGRNGDLDVLEGVIRKLDVMLAQVAVRAVIMEVNLNENLSYGIDWLQRSLNVNNVREVNGVKVREPVMSFGGGLNTSPSSTAFRDAAEVGRDISLSPGALSYFTTFYDYNLDAVLRLAQGSSDAKVIATPIIVTTDNTEATIVVGERRAIPTTTATTIGGSVQSAFEYENIGLDLTVTPRINPQGVVIMEIAQSSENVGGSTVIDGNEVPIITTRQLEASVAIRSGGTLALGGLVREDERESVTKVPILGSIPLLGALFRSQTTDTVRTELLVLISPEVVVTAEEAESLTQELKQATELGKSDWYRGWDMKIEEIHEDPEGEEKD